MMRSQLLPRNYNVAYGVKMMKFIAGAVLLLLVLFFVVPMIAGGSTDICKAVESHNVRSTAANIAGSNSGMVYNTINSIGQMGATGNAEAAMQSNAHPNTPTGVSCAASFWQSI